MLEPFATPVTSVQRELANEAGALERSSPTEGSDKTPDVLEGSTRS
jgi:hypothetical protein